MTMDKIINLLTQTTEAIEEFDKLQEDTDLFMMLCEIETMIEDLKKKL
jgi:hypothetical protein